MGFAVRAFDEAPGQGRRPVVGLRVVSRQVSAADLIRHRVDLALADLPETESIDTAARHAHPDEIALHPDRHVRRRLPFTPPTPEVAHTKALAAFSSGKILLLVNERQIEDPDALIGLTDDTEITFLRLVPLVGG